MLGRAPAGSDRHGALLQNPTQPACAGNKELARHLRQPGRVIRWRRDGREGDARRILACSLQQRLETASRWGGWGAFHGLICALISPSPVSDFPLRSGKKRYVTCPFVYSSVQSASDLTRHMERFPDSLDFFFDSISNIYLRKCQKRSDGTNLLFFTFKTDESPDPVFG